MTLVRYLMEGGTQGAAVTTGNSGASAVSAAGGSITFASARGRNGLGIDFTASTAGQCSTRWPTSAANVTVSFRAWFWGSGSTPSATVGICNFHSAPASVAARVQWTTANALILVPVTGGNLTIASGLNPAAQFDLSIQLTVGSPGSITATLRSTTGTILGTVSSSSFNSNTAAINEVAVGILGTYNPSYANGWDEISLDDSSTSEIPLYTIPSASDGPADMVWTSTGWR